MGEYIGLYTVRNPGSLKTLSPEEAAAYWSEEAVAERERNAPESRE